MTRLVKWALLMIGLLIVATPVWATHTVGQPTPVPAFVGTQVATSVTFTSMITDPDVIPGSAKLQRLVKKKWKTLGKLQAAGNGRFTFTTTLNEPTPGEARFRASALFRRAHPKATDDDDPDEDDDNDDDAKIPKPRKRARSTETVVTIGIGVQPGAGATISGPNGTTLTIAPGTSPVALIASITPASSATIVASTGTQTVAAVVSIFIQTTDVTPGHTLITKPLNLSVPAPAGTTNGTKYIVAQQVMVDFITGQSGGIGPALVPVDTATATGGQIVTSTTKVLGGIFGGGLFAILQVGQP